MTTENAPSGRYRFFGNPDALFQRLLSLFAENEYYGILQRDDGAHRLQVRVPALILFYVCFDITVIADENPEYSVVTLRGYPYRGRMRDRLAARPEVLETASEILARTLKARLGYASDAMNAKNPALEQQIEDITGAPLLPLHQLRQLFSQRGTVDDKDILRLGASVYERDRVSAGEAEELFRLNEALTEKSPTWITFFTNAVCDHYYWRKGADSVLSTAEAEHLLAQVRRDDTLDEASELRILLHLCNRVASAPPVFHEYLLQAVEHSVLRSTVPIYGFGGRTAGVVDADDVAMLRLALYGPGSEHSLRISRREAEVLLRLDKATAGADNHADWPVFFRKALANHLFLAPPSTGYLDEEEAAWLASQLSAPLTAAQRHLLDGLAEENVLPPVLAARRESV